MSGRQGEMSVQAMAEDIDALEVRNDTLALRLARLETANDERLPMTVVSRMSDGEHPLRVWREHRALGRAELAASSGVAEAEIAAIEDAGRDPALGVAVALARALEIDAEDLLPWRQD